MEPSLQFEEGIEKTIKWYLKNKEWMDNVSTGIIKTTIKKCQINLYFSTKFENGSEQNYCNCLRLF